jgi:hypothetical protein
LVAKKKKEKRWGRASSRREHDDNNKGEVEFQKYTVIDYFCKLITVPTLINLDLQDLF